MSRLPTVPEQPIIRPPSEAASVLVRATRGCGWNRCRFCGIYPSFGEPGHSFRSAKEVCRDVRALAAEWPGAESVFIGDADPPAMPLADFEAILREIHAAFPKAERVTAYARASTLWRLRPEGLARLAAAGLTRVHVGLESGDFATLRLMRKGYSPRILVESGRWTKAAGLELSWYVLLGLGGLDRWREHADGTAAVVNAVDPHFIRLRRLWIYGGDDPESPAGMPESPLWALVRAGRFRPQTPEGTVHELRRFLERLEGVSSELASDHGNNYVRVAGRLMADRDGMIEEIDRFLAWPVEKRQRRYRLAGSQL
ncbi:MAG TPA: radical SAM protein [Planctomycetota bacterium]|nr:radical SAM protein [Planctomycetota bacterium]